MLPIQRLMLGATFTLFGFVIVCEILALLREQLRDLQMNIAEEAMFTAIDCMPIDHPRTGLYKLAVASFTAPLDAPMSRVERSDVVDIVKIINRKDDENARNI